MVIEPFSAEIKDGYIWGRGTSEKLITRIEERLIPKLGGRYNEYMGPSILNFGRIEGGSQPSTVADWCSIQIDRRYIPGESVESVFNEFQELIDELKLEDSQFDAALLSHFGNIPTVITGPGDIAYSHTKDERISIKHLVDYVEIYGKIVEEFCEIYL